MGWTLSSIVRPTLDLHLVKDQCRIPRDWDGDNLLLTRFVAAAFVEVEKASERYLGKATATYMGCPHFHTGDGLYIGFDTREVVPLRSSDGEDIERGGIVSVEYRHTDATWHAIDEENYSLEEIGKEPARILLATGVTTGLDSDYRFPYRITVNIGYEAANLPEAAVQATLMLVAEYYRHRESMTVERINEMAKTWWDQQIRNLQWRFRG